ncbi:MAG: DNRLRE domain-containing protein [Phycisphaerales bacterium]
MSTVARGTLAAATLAAGSIAASASAEIATLDASLDATLYEYTTVPLANGAGEWFFAGMNNQGLRRRGLLSFDLAAFIDSIGGEDIEIHSVSLELSLTQGGGAETAIDLHRVGAAWGEGTSDASGNEGSGAPATPGSATWFNTFFDASFWSNPGGDFAAESSATLTVGENGAYGVSSEGMRQDVIAWIENASTNFGWILIGDETQMGTARRFDSRNNELPGGRPRLVIDYTVVPAPAVPAILAAFGIAGSRRRRH